MHEAAWIAIGLLGLLLLVVAVAMLRYITLARWQKSIHHAWFESGWCPGDQCGMESRTDLGLPQVKGTTDFDLPLARIMMDYVVRIEKRSFRNATDADLITPPGHTELERYVPSQYRAPPLAVAWRVNGTGTVVLSFRCTVTDEEIQEDLRATQVDWDTGDTCHQPRSLCMSAALVHGDRAQVHQGFYGVYRNYRTLWRDRIQLEQPDTLLIAGHSLGGGLATLTALDMAETMGPWLRRILVYVCGTPRVGNGAFHTRLKSHPRITLWRLVNDTDLIQNMPPHVHPNLERPDMRPFYYEHTGSEYRFNTNWGAWKHNHFLPVYLDHLHAQQPETAAPNAPNP